MCIDSKRGHIRKAILRETSLNCDVGWLAWNSLRIAAGLCVWGVGRTCGWENETGRTGGRKKWKGEKNSRFSIHFSLPLIF